MRTPARPACANCGHDLPRVVGTAEAAKILGYRTGQGVRDLVKRTGLPHFRIGGSNGKGPMRFLTSTLYEVLRIAEESGGSIPDAVRWLKQRRKKARRDSARND